MYFKLLQTSVQPDLNVYRQLNVTTAAGLKHRVYTKQIINLRASSGIEATPCGVVLLGDRQLMFTLADGGAEIKLLMI